MQRNMLETVLGAVVLLVAAIFVMIAYRGGEVQVEDGYAIGAKFDNISGISVGSDVRIGGIKVGVVTGLDLDEETYQAKATMNIRYSTKIPEDTSASVMSSGLLGDKFVQLTPGAMDEMLTNGGEIEYTQSSVSLEELIGKYVFSGGGVESDNAATPDATPPAPEITDSPL